MPISRTLRVLTSAFAACLLVFAVSASAASARTHPSLKGPKRGTVFAVGADPTFKVTDTSRNAKKYRVFMRISNKKKFGRRTGDLLSTKTGTFTSMKRKGSTFTYTAENYTFPGWFMATPGKYYWQAFHIDCRVKGCHVHSKLGSFLVR